jgi:hypothetical protein
MFPRQIDNDSCRDKITRMTPPHSESLYHPYTKKTLALVRCAFSVISAGLAVAMYWRPAVAIGILFLGFVWIIYETSFRSHRHRREEILNHGRKTTAIILGKTNDFRRRLCFFRVQYEYDGQPIETMVCVPDLLYHQHEVDDRTEVLVSGDHPKQCIVLPESLS